MPFLRPGRGGVPARPAPERPFGCRGLFPLRLFYPKLPVVKFFACASVENGARALRKGTGHSVPRAHGKGEGCLLDPVSLKTLQGRALVVRRDIVLGKEYTSIFKNVGMYARYAGKDSMSP